MAKETTKNDDKPMETKNPPTTKEELEIGLNDYIKEFTTVKKITYGEVLSVLKNLTENMETMNLYGVARNIFDTMWEQKMETKE